MGHWLDALAKASAGRRGPQRTSSPPRASGTPRPGRPDISAPAALQQGLSRRELLQRGAVVGAAVWTVPALQSALAPAAAASPPPVCTVNCPPGSACATNTNCSTGLCLNGICVIPYGGAGTCTANNQCQSGNCLSGTCAASWPGTTCTSSSQCLSGKCTGGTCKENPLGGYCRATADCADNMACSAGGICGGVGASCQNKNKCLSGKCTGGICRA